MPTSALNDTIQPSWQAHLKLAFAARPDGSFMTERRHSGPLRVQKPLYPEGGQICHAVIVHPPGGIAGGDALTIEVDVGAASHAVLATPGATKWYKSNRRSARQHVTLRVHEDAHLDWLPQNNIVFDDARAELDLTLVIAASGSAIGWEATQLGRQAAGESWNAGHLHATTTLMRPDGELLWTERAILAADDPLRDAPQGLGGWPAFGTLWAIGPARSEQTDAALHEQLTALLGFDANLRSGFTCLPGGVLLIRAVARQMQALQALQIACWNLLRPVLHGVPAQPLRLWST